MDEILGETVKEASTTKKRRLSGYKNVKKKLDAVFDVLEYKSRAQKLNTRLE